MLPNYDDKLSIGIYQNLGIVMFIIIIPLQSKLILKIYE